MGAGAGAAIHYIKHFFPGVALSAIEISQEIIDIGKKYFAVPAPIIKADAFCYLEQQSCYDYILIDLFTSDQLPSKLLTTSFLQNCLDKSVKGISINLTADNQNALISTVRRILTLVTNPSLCLFIKDYQNIVLTIFKEDPLPLLRPLIGKGWLEKPLWRADIGMFSMIAKYQ